MTTLIRAKSILTLDGKDHLYQPGYLIVENDRILDKLKNWILLVILIKPLTLVTGW
jgi:hypothetical protein